ncbi:MAG TPA: DnaD domain protein [Candidatus Avidehalobacter gallistercoris]|uniref:DnaD domain protein n=1 Tax=Candidatus Avidehalobacter gallistercoris TaxID=2840694 RepID=A0A9D1HMK5_9FIRM|nr:DnaD domain protein [Candidatus Avidehalobacter gallistercoris]
MMKHLTKNMEIAFIRSIYSNRTQVPDFLLANYAELGLSAEETLLLARLFGCTEPGDDIISESRLRMCFGGADEELSAGLTALAAKGMLSTDDVSGSYSLSGAYDRLLELWVFKNSVPTGQPRQKAAEQAQAFQTEAIKEVYAMFEAEFARPLSPLELQKLNAWLITDGWQPAMLREAARRAVLHGALSLAYIDKILLRWRSEGIVTPEQLADDVPEKATKLKARRGKKAAEPSFDSETDYGKYF